MKEDPEILYTPSPEIAGRSNIKAFEQWLLTSKNLRFADYDKLWNWSTDHIEEFWICLWEYVDIISCTPFQTVTNGLSMPYTRWFIGAKLNYAEHIFRNKTEEHPALIFRNENRTEKISWAFLECQVSILRQQLIDLGIESGDRVAGYLPNIPEAIISFLAVNSIGAVWSCCSPDYGENTVIDRFIQITPKVLICADGYQYNGKSFNRLSHIELIRQSISSIENTIFIKYLSSESHLDQSINYDDLKDLFPPKVIEFVPIEFNEPIWILFSSGTTGAPKAITHSAGGVLLEHYKYLLFHNDVHTGETFFWFTTTGWMMWNFLQASMLVGGIPVLYDGSPGYPHLNTLWEFAAELPINHFGTSAPYLSACMKSGIEPGQHLDFRNLRSIGSTGSPLPPEAYEWVYTHIKKSVWLCSMSGGTDVCTAFVGGHPMLPVYKGYIQCRALACALYAFDEDGNQIIDELGEMVITRPMPSMPIYFWNDPDNIRYHASYFENYPSMWWHGDYILIKPNGSLLIKGRSDATLNRKGVRIGTAEIYNILDGIAEISDAMVINLELQNGDDIMILFVVLLEKERLDDILKSRINVALKIQGSPRHVPDEIISVPQIPYTLNGKKMEIPVKKILQGRPIDKVVNPQSIKNPEAIDYIVSSSIEELRSKIL